MAKEGSTPSTRSTLAGSTSHVSKCYQLTHKAFDLKGLQEARLQCGRRGGRSSKVILDSDIFRHDIEVCGIDKSRGSALRESCIY